MVGLVMGQRAKGSVYGEMDRRCIDCSLVIITSTSYINASVLFKEVFLALRLCDAR